MRSTVKSIKDAVLIDGIVFLAVFGFVSLSATMSRSAWQPLLVVLAVVTVAAIMIGFASGLYADPMERSGRTYKKAVIGFGLWVCICIVIILLVEMSLQMKTGLILGLLTGTVAMLAVRPIGAMMTRSSAAKTNLLVLSAVPSGDPVISVSGHPAQSWSVEKVLQVEPGPQATENVVAQVSDFAARTAGRRAIVVSGTVPIEDSLRDCLSAATRSGCRVITLAGLTGMISGKVPLDDPDVLRMLFRVQELPARTARFLERAIDVSVSATLLILASPLIVAMAVAIRLEDGGPALFRQTRIGLHSKPFILLKFRTMRENAETAGRSQWAAKADHRVTRIGAYLRNRRLDELPQLVNVLKGEMSLVGPRPERPDLVDQLSTEIPLYNFRHLSRPGLSGWAQVNFPYAASIEDTREKTCYDLFYVLNHSPLLNIIILLQTMRVVIFAEGAR